jgi:hypothetical protein
MCGRNTRPPLITFGLQIILKEEPVVPPSTVAKLFNTKVAVL